MTNPPPKRLFAIYYQRKEKGLKGLFKIWKKAGHELVSCHDFHEAHCTAEYNIARCNTRDSKIIYQIKAIQEVNSDTQPSDLRMYVGI